MTKNCAYCGKRFTPAVHNQIYCSQACKRKQEAERKRTRLSPKICVICGKEFQPTHPVQVACPGECREKRRREHNKGGKRPEEKDTRMLLERLNEDEMLAELNRRGYAVRLEGIEIDRKRKLSIERFKGDSIKIAAISCTHIGSRYQQMTYLHEFYRLCGERGISTVLHCGDLVEGTGRMYSGQLYEMFCIGYDNQLAYAAENYPREEGIKTLVIEGNHDYSWHKAQGISILKALAKEREDIEYLGAFSAYVEVEGISFHVMHGSGGMPYAVSYRPQGVVRGYSPEKKPHVLFYGHLHVPCHLPAYRNVEAFLIPCFQSQTPFLKAKGLQPVIGGLLLEVITDSKGIASVRTEWPLWHIAKENDY